MRIVALILHVLKELVQEGKSHKDPSSTASKYSAIKKLLGYSRARKLFFFYT